MRSKFHILILVSLPVLLSLVSCSEAEKPAPEPVTTTDSTSKDSTAMPPKMDSLAQLKATETFRGALNEQEIIFSHTDFQSYTLSMAGQLTSGHLNTERGYGDDRNATVYVLDDDKPKKEQKYFVRTPRGSIYLLDQERYVVDDAIFDAVKVTKAKPKVKTNVKPTVEPEATVDPLVEKKPAAVEPVKKKASSKKSLRKKKRSASKKIVKAPSKKTVKAPSKKTVKAPSKKTVKASSKKTVKDPGKKAVKVPSKKTVKAPSKETVKAPETVKKSPAKKFIKKAVKKKKSAKKAKKKAKKKARKTKSAKTADQSPSA